MIKSYRGQLSDGGQDQIRLKTQKGDIGYQIVKFELMIVNPGTANSEHCVKIFKVRQLGTISVTAVVVDFTDGDILAVGIVSNSSSGYSQIYNAPPVIFDNQIVNQDIYITHTETHSNEPVNYYIELEQVPLNENESTMATLQSLRRVAER